MRYCFTTADQGRPIKTPTSAETSEQLGKSNGAKETRTPDPLHAMQVLYQLSYGPMVVGWALEPVNRREEAYTGRVRTPSGLNLPPHSNELALHLHLISGQLNRLIGRIGGFQSHSAPTAMEVFQRGATAWNQSTHDRALA